MHVYIVSVQYSDILSITLPYNRHHFKRVTLVTSTEDVPNVIPIANKNHAEIVVTDLFYDNGATFNKWAALEYAMDINGRDGWLCLMDADILWPKLITWREWDHLDLKKKDSIHCLVSGHLYTPLRRMFEDTSKPIPHESCWELYPIHPNVNEWAGYSQIFHGDDPHLGNTPWHQIDWIHAGGADSFFQRKWPPHHKIRPPFEVLHIGPAGKNWFGRATPYLDGTLNPEAKMRQRRIDEMWSGRRRRQSGPDRFSNEKIT